MHKYKRLQNWLRFSIGYILVRITDEEGSHSGLVRRLGKAVYSAMGIVGSNPTPSARDIVPKRPVYLKPIKGAQVFFVIVR